jgi:hypothetical protein
LNVIAAPGQLNRWVALLAMDNIQTSKHGEAPMSRRAWLVLTLVYTTLSLIQLLRWTERNHWDDFLPNAAIIILFLGELFQLKGLAKRFSQILIGSILVLCIVMFIVRW